MGKAICWDQPAEKAFQDLKTALAAANPLKFPDRNKGYQIFTDASDTAIGGALQQDTNPIAFFSKKLDSAQRNYMTYEKEALALVLTVKQWHHLIHNGKQITAYCDNRGVACLLKQTFNIARQARWAAFLQQYNLTIEFIAGKDNVVADAFTRQYDDTEATTPEDVNLIQTLHDDTLYDFADRCDCDTLTIGPQTPTHMSFLPLLDTDADKVTQPALSTSDVKRTWRKAYLADTHTAPYYSHLADGTSLGCRSQRYTLSGGLLRTCNTERVVIPMSMRPALLNSAHTQHVGAEKMAHRLAMFYWPNMLPEIRAYTQSCLTCMRSKGSPIRIAGEVHALDPATAPFTRLHFDLVGPLPDAKIGNRTYNSLFTVIDSFSKFAWAIPTTNKVTAREISQLFLTHVLPFTSVPDEIVTDRGPQFIQQLFTELIGVIGITHKLPSPYHPQSNGALERWHRDLNSHLRIAVLSLKDDKSWVDGIGVAMYTHNTTLHTTLGCSPYELCFGFTANCPIAQWKALNLPTDDTITPHTQDRLEAIKHYRDMATKALYTAQQKMQQVLENRVRNGKQCKVGDWVLVRANRGDKLPKLMPRVLGPFQVTKVSGGQITFETGMNSRMVPMANFTDVIPYDEPLTEPHCVLEDQTNNNTLPKYTRGKLHSSSATDTSHTPDTTVNPHTPPRTLTSCLPSPSSH